MEKTLYDQEFIDLHGIAELLDVSPHTPNQWRHRGVLPPPMPEVSRPLWFKRDIMRWARSTGRWPPGSVGHPELRGPRSRPATRVPVEPPVKRYVTPEDRVKLFAEDRRKLIPAAIFVPPPEEDELLAA